MQNKTKYQLTTDIVYIHSYIQRKSIIDISIDIDSLQLSSYSLGQDSQPCSHLVGVQDKHYFVPWAPPNMKS